MAWSNLPATASTDWQSASFCQQFVDAIRERQLISSGSSSGLADVSAGTDIQKLGSSGVFGWNYLQSAVTGLCTSFANSEDYSGGFDGLTDTSLPLYTLTTFFAAIGLDWSSGGFTRKFPRTINLVSPPAGTLGQRAYSGTQNSETTGNSHGSSSAVYEYDGSSWVLSDDQVSAVDVLTAYGYMQQGDYIGIWIFNELYDALNALRWTVIPHADLDFDGVEYYLGNGVSAAKPTWAEAKTYIESIYADAGGMGDSFSFGTEGYYGRSTYGGLMASFVGTITGTVPTSSYSHACDLYIRPYQNATSSDVVFDATVIGLASTYNGKWGLVDTTSVSATTNRTTNEFGTSDMPAWCPEPTAGHTPKRLGFNSSISSFLLRWDVPGGLTYIN